MGVAVAWLLWDLQLAPIPHYWPPVRCFPAPNTPHSLSISLLSQWSRIWALSSFWNSCLPLHLNLSSFFQLWALFFSLTMISSYLLLNSASVRGAIWLRGTGPDIVASSASGGLSRCRPVPASWLSLSPPSALADGLYPHSCRWLLHCKSPVFIPDQKKEGTRRKYWYLYEEVSEIPQRTYAYFQLVRSTSHTHP